ncbi:MAG: NAD(P)H-hydrate dehydratase [Taibaiella sp.]|nr:NAD(P)H-hydrate dehydratase [Taibaiella sp.]
MKIFTAVQIKECDAATIKASAIFSGDLMERAALKCVDWLRDNYPKETLFVVLCGTGNNGGDGLAITRLLSQRNFGVKAFLLHFGASLSDDCSANYHRLRAINESLVTDVAPETFIADLPGNLVIIDAMFGTGLDRPAAGWAGEFITRINNMPNTKISIDMPSGLAADIIPDKEWPVMKADHTLTFQFYKRTFLHPESAPFAGKLHVLDIGLNETYIINTHSQYRLVEKKDILAVYKPRGEFGHKGTFGSALMAGGSYGKTGAMVLTAKAALRSGAGLVTAVVPECGYVIMQTALPEAMCTVSGVNEIDSISYEDKYNAIGVGPGLGTHDATIAALTTFLDEVKVPVVLDADALNIIAEHKELLNKLPPGSVITPHPKEFSRLFGDNTNSMIQVDNARIQAMRYNINIVLKGHHTAVINTEGECSYNMTGNSGMATAGSGDVLTGIITGLIAQGYGPADAAMFGVYLHGAAGDLAVKVQSEESMIAGDIIEHLGKVFHQLTE